MTNRYSTPQQHADEALAEDQARRKSKSRSPSIRHAEDTAPRAASALKQQTTDLSVVPPGAKRAAMYDKPMTPMELLARAVEGGATIEVLTGLMDLQERYERAQERREASQALKNFDAAIAAAKAEIPVIVKGTQGHNYVYADFAAIARVVDPILSKHGLQYRFRTQQAGPVITVTCVLFGHGHKEECTLSGAADTSGQKNAIQSLGSTLTYLQRYTLVQQLGLATSKDDDGRGGNGDSGGVITLQQVEQLIALCDETATDKEAFCEYFKIAGIAELPAKKYDDAMGIFARKKAARAKTNSELAQNARAQDDTFPGDRPL